MVDENSYIPRRHEPCGTMESFLKSPPARLLWLECQEPHVCKLLCILGCLSCVVRDNLESLYYTGVFFGGNVFGSTQRWCAVECKKENVVV